ncbi:hypothetical protein [Apilactobacillus micheneri]|uniref:Surface layer protein A domain-containing protein n=1 Tax=Apilactobacillus micheneri TaxID=1899430 RepID=A0A9Q8ILT1_9LACO|nr:hypothetical protein [Apilactobacillus micheneri]TPR39868.1 hypothetical protein DY121_04990 [Apilactobacillus micheneri]TPR43789.1 hypothetical protein DY130_04985 [Apilactobacillus micheneri]TPR45342.1 hypothetical protein DY128_04985 [Apilactobacillus micheneri]TPR51035.1 hypothetical protein DY126_05705 [Apilactobacillus micheneri]
MNFKKNVAAILTGITLASMPAMAVSANGMPKNSSNYWNKVRYIKVNKNISAVQRKVKNNSIQPKINKKMTVKKGTVLVVDRLKSSHNEWLLLDGLKNSKNSVWSTNQKNTNWMSKYTPKKIDNTTKLVTLTKKINITEKATKNHQIQNKTLKKSSLKKGSVVYVRSFGGNEWLVFGNNMPKTSKNGAWVTNNKGTNWMKKYTPKPISNKYIDLNQDVSITEKAVKNNVIQNKNIKKDTLKSGTTILVKPLSKNEVLILSSNVPNTSKNGAWIIQGQNNKFSDSQILKSQYNTTPTSDIGSDYTDAYFQSNIGNKDKTIATAGQKVQAKKVDDNNALIKVDGNEYPMPISKDIQLPTRNNVYASQKSNIVFSLYAPNDSNAVTLSSYTPQNGDQWRQMSNDGKLKVFEYLAKDNGWLHVGDINTNNK